MKKPKNLPWLSSFFYLAFLIVFSACGSSRAVASPGISNPDAGQEVTFMPENELHLEDSFFLTNMTEREFSAVVSKLQKLYQPLVSRMGARLSIIGKWYDNTVNAYAYQQGGTWYVEILGGLARRPEISVDGLSMVVCHELGHHLGGFPTYPRDWASSEGQSDYYASQACAKKLWAYESAENQRAYEEGSEEAVAFCENSRLQPTEVPLCVRTLDASIGLARLLNGGGSVSLYTPDRTVVRTTQTSHPRGQCRLDTYAQGAICTADWNFNSIPRTELQSRNFTCTRARNYEEGNRPLCWFKPSR